MRANLREKAEVISFKADTQLASALNALDNRSEFIRQALRASLDHQCPLCAGAGVLDADQQRHLRTFLQHHEIHECKRCHALHLDDKFHPPPAKASCPPLAAARKSTRPHARRRTAAALAGLFLLASLAAGVHWHEHDDRCEGNGIHSFQGLCSACVFKATPLLSGDILEITLEAVPVCTLALPGESTGGLGSRIDLRSRAPPLSRA